MATTKNKPKSRTSQTRLQSKQGFHFRWWMAVILVVIIALVGIVIIRSSFAFGGGKIYIEQEGSGPYVSYDFNFDGSVNLTESITGASKKNVPFAQARAVGLQMVQDAYRNSGRTDVADAINPSSLPPSVTNQVNSATQAGQKAAQTQQANQTAQPAPTAPTQPTTETSTSTTTQTDSSGNSSQSTTEAKSYPVSGTVDFKMPAALTAQAKSVTYRIDGNELTTSTKSPFLLTLNSTKYLNGTHLLQVTVTNKDGNAKTYIYALNITNPTDWWSRFVQKLQNAF